MPPNERQQTEDVSRLAETVYDLTVWARRFHDAIAITLWGTLAKVLVFIVSNSSFATFGAADTTKAVAFEGRELDTSYQVAVTPSWDTRVWVTGKTVTGFTITVSTGPGGAGGTVDWSVVR
jgi:hypothetical protein